MLCQSLSLLDVIVMLWCFGRLGWDLLRLLVLIPPVGIRHVAGWPAKRDALTRAASRKHEVLFRHTSWWCGRARWWSFTAVFRACESHTRVRIEEEWKTSKSKRFATELKLGPSVFLLLVYFLFETCQLWEVSSCLVARLKFEVKIHPSALCILDKEIFLIYNKVIIMKFNSYVRNNVLWWTIVIRIFDSLVVSRDVPTSFGPSDRRWD